MAHTGLITNAGNTKLGRKVTVINRLPGTTCPGASEWCSTACYAKKGRTRMAHPRYSKPLPEVEGAMLKNPLVRFHVSGDFDSTDYINWAIELATNHPEKRFWSYTRSWRLPELKEKLEELRALPNVQLFASMDTSIMEYPPANWRIAFITGDDRFQGVRCPEQTGKLPDCTACGFCFRPGKGNVQFQVH